MTIDARNRSIRYLPYSLAIFVVLLLFACLPPRQAASGQTVALTPHEQEWLRNHPVIHLAPDPEFKPIEYFDGQGVYQGVAADHVRLLEQKLGIRFRIVKLKNWDAVMEKFRAGEVETLGAIVPTPQRKTFMRISTPLFNVPGAILVRNGVDVPLDVQKLAGLKVAVVSNYTAHNILKDQYPEIRLDVVPDTITGLTKTSFGVVDAFVENLATATFYMQEAAISNLHVAGNTPFVYQWGIGIRKDWPELESILNKGIAAITEDERRAILNRWLPVQKSWKPSTEDILALTATSAGILFGAAILWGWSLRMLVGVRTKALNREIEERRRAEEALQLLNQELETRVRERTSDLQRSEEKFRSIFDNSPLGLVLFDGTSTVLDCNQALADILDSEKQRYVGMNLLETLVDPLHRATIQEIFRTGLGVFEGPYTSILTGKQLYVSLRGIQIGPNLFLAIIEDITKRKATEHSLRESEDRFRAIFESVNDAIFIHDMPSGLLIDINQRTCEMYGFPHDEVLQADPATMSSGVPPYDRDHALAWLHRAAAEGPQTFEWHARRKDGTLFWVEVSLRMTQIGPKDYIIASVRDVTGRKQLEEQLHQSQKMEAIGVLAGGVAHDFNNILQAIMSSANLIKLRFRGQDALDHIVDDILTLSERAADLTRGLLAFSRKQVIAPRPQDLNELVEAVAKLYTRLLGEDIELRLELSAGRLGVNVDSSQMQQVILNLLTNARDAMPTGGTLTIRTAQEPRMIPNAAGSPVEKPCAVLTIRDTGLGIAGKDLPRIFEPFYTTKEVGKGTGLGLSVAYGIVRQHGGAITVTSRPGAGTEFTVLLPAVTPHAVHTPEPTSFPEPGSGETILLVEDDQQVRTATASILRAYGFTVLAAAHGAEALELHHQHQGEIRLALLDVIMPGMNGEQVYEKLAAEQPDIKVIFLSGYANDILEQKQLREVMYLPKPVMPSDLIRAIKAVIAS